MDRNFLMSYCMEADVARNSSGSYHSSGYGSLRPTNSIQPGKVTFVACLGTKCSYKSVNSVQGYMPCILSYELWGYTRTFIISLLCGRLLLLRPVSRIVSCMWHTLIKKGAHACHSSIVQVDICLTCSLLSFLL